jgi:hypothetical protein
MPQDRTFRLSRAARAAILAHQLLLHPVMDHESRSALSSSFLVDVETGWMRGLSWDKTSERECLEEYKERPALCRPMYGVFLVRLLGQVFDTPFPSPGEGD